MYWVFEEKRNGRYVLVEKFDSLDKSKIYISDYNSLSTDLNIRHFVYSITDRKIVYRNLGNKKF